jgi:ABC-type branched-subunit amino acid transport system ATPase component
MASTTTSQTPSLHATAPLDGMLSVEGVTVRFGGVTANNNVTLGCREGLVTALLGPNGAGKTTLFNVITGAQVVTGGKVFFAGADVTGLPHYRRARLGIARTFQNTSLARDLPVFENVLLGAVSHRSYGSLAALLATPRVRRDDRNIRLIAEKALAVVGMSRTAGERTGNLSYGQLRRIEIARALAMGPRLLMLDEPTAGMDRRESAELAKVLLDLRSRLNLTIFVVEHDVEFVQNLADWAYVLDFGELIASGTVADVLSTPAVQEAYLGTMTDA